jgi:hypothetical protein
VPTDPLPEVPPAQDFPGLASAVFRARAGQQDAAGAVCLEKTIDSAARCTKLAHQPAPSIPEWNTFRARDSVADTARDNRRVIPHAAYLYYSKGE